MRFFARNKTYPENNPSKKKPGYFFSGAGDLPIAVFNCFIYSNLWGVIFFTC
jgi:hypothetical protein